MLKNTGTGEEGFAFSNAEKLRVELKITDVTQFSITMYCLYVNILFEDQRTLDRGAFLNLSI